MTATSRAPRWIGQARRQLARYLEEGTSEILPLAATANSPVHHQNPHEIYFDSSRDQVAIEAPYPLIPTLALPPGHAYAGRHPDGTPLLVYRDKKDPSAVRAYVNSCRHRGSPLLREPREFATTPLKAPLLTCPYHAWTYDAQNGELKKIPGHKKAFALMDQETFGLTALTCKEAAGIVWVGGDAMRDNGMWCVEESTKELEPFLYSAHSAPKEAYKVFGFREWTLQANWQLAVETALESYHIKSLHANTFHTITHPSWGMATQYVDDNRSAIMTVPLRNFQAEADEQDVPAFLGQTTTTALLFPSTLLTLAKRFCIVNTIEPIDNTSSKVRSWSMPHRFCNPDEDDQLAKRDYNSVVVAVEEDWECTEQIQKGLKGGSSSDFVFGGYEGNNVRFLKNVGEAAEQLKQVKGATTRASTGIL